MVGNQAGQHCIIIEVCGFVSNSVGAPCTGDTGKPWGGMVVDWETAVSREVNIDKAEECYGTGELAAHVYPRWW